MPPTKTKAPSEGALRARVAELALALATTTAELAAVTKERDALRKAYAMVLGQLELVRHRLDVAKAERIGNVAQLEIEFAAKKAELDALVKKLEESAPPMEEPPAPPGSKQNKPNRGGGRRNLEDADIKEVRRIVITDPLLEGTAERVGYEETIQFGYQRGCAVKIVIARATYKTKTENGLEFSTAPVPRPGS